MKGQLKLAGVAGVAVLVYAIVMMGSNTIVKIFGGSYLLMYVVLAMFGVLSTALAAWILRDRSQDAAAEGGAAVAPEQVAQTNKDVDRLLTAAKAHLTQSKAMKRAHFGSLPVVLLVGPEGSTKTTIVVRSGLEPELLAGDVFRGETVAPTKVVNLWYSQGTVFAEAGGPLLGTPESWKRFVRALRPRSLLAALTGKPQPPRYAVVCFGCDEFLKPGSGENVPAAARALRERLGQAAGQLGIQLPTYVLFTRADAIPHFDAYVRNLSNDESREPVGASLQPDTGGTGTYADRAGARLDKSLQELCRSLARRRLQVLAREHSPEWKPGAYEFPRELRKLTPLMVDFMREIGRPSELQAGPVLRGFYFTGVQAVFINEVTPDYVSPAQQARAAATRNATAVFSAEQLAQAAAGAAGAPRTRKVPRWDFMPRVLREVVLADDAAVRLTQGGERVSLWRRVGLAAASVACLLLLLFFSVSYAGNRGLESRATEAASGLATVSPNNVDFPPIEALQRLDVLRAQLDTLSTYEHDGAPLDLRWGLYSGSSLYPEVRGAYFAGFNRLMFANAKGALISTLRMLPDTARASDDYGETYGVLKAYLIVTAYREKSTSEFLAPVLMKQWVAGRPLDGDRAQLAQRQFETYARELRFENPFPDRPELPLVARARVFLRQFSGSERIYQFMLAEAAKKNPPVHFNRNYAGSVQYIIDPYEVPGGFTKGGFAFMQGAFKTVEQYLGGEPWVIGEGQQQIDRAKLVSDLRAQYARDYAEHWRKFLRSASVVRYANVSDAAKKLLVFSGNQSPLLELFSLASRHTAVAAPEIASIFQPVQSVTPPADTLQLVGKGNQMYMGALLALQSSVEGVSNAQGTGAEQAAAKAAGDAAAAKTAARQMAATFTVDQQGQLHTAVQSLLEAPIAYAEPLLNRFGADQVNKRGGQFCSVARSLMNKLPFNPNSNIHASIAEVAAVLRPGTGSLWTLYNDVLQGSLQKQGNGYVAVPGNVHLTPGFVAFFNRAALLSDVLFAGGGNEPKLSFGVSPVVAEGTNSVAITLEGDLVRTVRGANKQSTQIEWPGARQEARLSTQLSGGSVTGGSDITIIGPYTGPWALFQLFYAADNWPQPQPGAPARAEFQLRSGTQALTLPNGAPLRVAIEVSPASVAAVLKRGNYVGGDCPSDIAR